jgi:hypothetical protein
LGFEAEVEIIDTKIFEEDEEIDLQLSIGKPEKKRISLLDAQKLMRKETFAAMMVNGEKPMA